MRWHELRRLVTSRFARNLRWLGGGEAMIRITRLAATMILARCLAPEAYGVAAIALTVHEMVFVLARNGLAARIIRAGDENVDRIADTAYRLNWMVAVGLFLLQCAVAGPVARSYDEPALRSLVLALAASHLISPLSLVPWAMIQREERLKTVSLVNVCTVGTDNLLTAAFALAGLGAWAVVLPKILVAPLWVAILRRCRPWSPTPGAGLRGWREILRFGRRILASEALKALCSNLDYLLVGRFLGLEALGLYYFAFNAGLGFSQTLLTAFSTSLYPHLCAVRDRGEELRRRLSNASRTIALTAVPLVLLQCVLAPLYVPLLYGERWLPAISALVLLCLSALPRLLGTAGTQVLRVLDRTDVELRWSFARTLILAALLAAALVPGLEAGIFGIATAVLCAHLAVLPFFTLSALRRIPGDPLAAHSHERRSRCLTNLSSP